MTDCHKITFNLRNKLNISLIDSNSLSHTNKNNLLRKCINAKEIFRLYEEK